MLDGEAMAIAYSGFRSGQHPDRGDGAVNPSEKEILEDLEVIATHDFHLIRLGAEKHWGLFNVDRTPKLALK